MVTPAIPPPNYGTLDNTQLGRTLGDLPTDYARAQLLQLAQQQEQMQLDQQKKTQGAFAGGLPMQNGQVDTSQAMQTLAKLGLLQPNDIAQLSRVGLEQQQITQAATPSPLFGGAAQPAGDQLSRLEAGVAKVETGGEKNPYSAKGTVTNSGDRAYGKYQVMGANIPSWTKEVLGREMTPQEFLADPDAQEKVARAKLGGYLQTYGDAPDAASMWFTGKPLAKGANKTDINGMTGARYAAAATGSMNDATPRIPVSAAGGSALTRGGDSAAPGGARPTAGASGSVATLFQGLSQNQQTNLAKVLGAPDVNAPLTPEQVTKAQTVTQKNPALRGATQQTAQPGPAGGQEGAQPIIPQVPLPKGFTDPQKAILALDQEMARMSGNPAAAGQVKALADWRDRIAASTAPMEVRPGQTIIDPRTGKTLFQGQYPGGNLDPRATENAAENYIKTGKLPPGIGRGAQGPQEIAQILSRAAQLAEERGIDPDKLAENWQAFGARSGGLKSVFQRATGLTLVENEANRLVPRVRELLPKLDHTQYPTINAAINAYKKSTGDENIVKFGISAESLSSVYARILKGGGTPTGGETERAHGLLDKAWSAGQIGAALDQMELELQSAKQSTDDTLREFGLSTKDISPSAAPSPPAASAPKTLSTKAEFDALPSGAEFIAPDGSHRRKP